MSDKIKQIPFFFVYFLPIDHFKNLDAKYKQLPHSVSNIVQRDIKYKIIYFKNICYNITKANFYSHTFPAQIYHVFFSASILHDKQISFTINYIQDNHTSGGYNKNGTHIDQDQDQDQDQDDHSVIFTPFIIHDQSQLPLLNNFSASFHFPSIRYHNMKMYFSRTLLTNPYIPFDIFLITYFLHNNIDTLTRNVLIEAKTIHTKVLYENIDRYDSLIKVDYIDNMVDSFVNHDTSVVVRKLLSFKYTWTYYSFCLFFLNHYPKLLEEHGLSNIFCLYIQSSPDERNTDLINQIYYILFTNI